MSQETPLRSATPQSVSVCGKLLSRGQSLVVAESAVGPKERTLEARNKIVIRDSNEKGKLQILCTMGE